MGGSKKQKVGNRYYYGVALVPCRQHDALLEIQMNDKKLWSGRVGAGQISPSKKSLFGGDEREGGFSGKIDIQNGDVDQPVNSYLKNAKSTLTSAMRGCVSLIFRQTYFSANTARLPSIRTKHINVNGIARGWQTAKAIIDPVVLIEGQLMYFTFDMDNSVTAASFTAMRFGLSNFILSLKGSRNSIRVQIEKAQTPTEFIEIYDCTDADYDTISDWVISRNRNSVNLRVNYADMTEAFTFLTGNDGSNSLLFTAPLFERPALVSDQGSSNKHVFVMAAKGLNQFEADAANQILNNIDGVQVTTIALINNLGVYPDDSLALIDNTIGDGVPLASTNDEVTSILRSPFLTWADMNPAHIIRCLWTDPMRGGTVSEAEIGDSFLEAADLYIAEGLGLSPKFRGVDQADTDRTDLERHIDAMTYRSNKTGKIEIVSVRDDYIVNDLVVFDSSIVTDWSGLSRPRKSEVPNQLTVNYTRRDGKKGSVTRTNVAGVRRQGRVIKAQPVSYPSCTTEALAVRLCLRDLRTVTTDILSGTLPLTHLPEDVELGTVITLNEPLIGINNVVVRVSETRIGQYDDSTATITVTEENFGTTQFIDIEEPDFSNVRSALPLKHRLVTEASYFQGVIAIGQQSIDDELSLEPDLGRLLATGSRADSNQLEALLATSTGSTWDDQGLVDFEPYGVLVNGLSADPTETTFLVNFNVSLTEITEGDLARIGDEIIRIDAIDDQSDGTVLITCGRGCLDGPPSKHASGEAFVISSVVEPLDTDFIAGQSIDVKMLSKTGSDELSLSEAETDTVLFDSRAIRPYPVGDLKVDGQYLLTGPVTGSVTLTWAHRDRTIQTTPAVDDFLAGDIGPETGVYYEIVQVLYQKWPTFYHGGGFYDRKFFYRNDVSVDELVSPVSPPQSTTADFTVGPVGLYDRVGFYDPDRFYGGGSFSSLTSAVGVGVRSMRDVDGVIYENWRTSEIVLRPLLPVSNLTGVAL